ncbi:MAG: C40 family peptidase [bacterium]|nr:C40 family peptidase [bacterium]
MKVLAKGRDRRRLLTAALAAIMAIVLCVGFCLSDANATPLSDKKAEAKAAKEKLDAMNAELDAASDKYYEALEAHDAAVAKMEETQARIDELKVEIQKSQDELSDRAVMMYRNGQTSMVDVLLGSRSYKDFATTWDMLNSLNDDTADLITLNKSLKAEAEELYEEYSKQEKIAADKLAEAEATKKEAEALVAQYQEEVDKLDAEVEKLIEEQRKAEEEAARRAWSNGNTGGTVSPSTGANVPPNVNANSVVGYAYSRLGCPYVWGAEGPNSFDCSGLTSWCYAQCGVYIPRTSGAQRAAGTVISLANAQPGDVLWMSGHVGIYIGGGAYIHAPQPGDVVKIAYNMGMWSCALRF